MNINVLDQFTIGYITAALWSSTDNSNEQGGEPLDKNYDISDLSDDCLKQIIEDCKAFQETNADLLNQYRNEISTNGQFSESEYAGHDFWLTRNGHGCGFWDRGLGQLGKELTEMSKPYGSCHLYVGDDRKIYCQ